MMLYRIRRGALLLASGALLLQVGGCVPTNFLEILQTIFLGVTAAASYAVLRNI
ncbi:MAG TPA: hypothetical protein VGM03_22445 [Phycisphaerae bacterium]|jgi:hypothetical protein